MLQRRDWIEYWLNRLPTHVEEGDVLPAISRIAILGGWQERPLGVDESKLFAVCVVAKDADPSTFVTAEIIEGENTEGLANELKKIFGIQRRGIDSSWSGFYFWIIPASSYADAWEIVCTVWHQYSMGRTEHPRPKKGDLPCPYTNCEYS